MLEEQRSTLGKIEILIAVGSICAVGYAIYNAKRSNDREERLLAAQLEKIQAHEATQPAGWPAPPPPCACGYGAR